MKEIIPFYKEIVFKSNIASIVNMSLEHSEKILDDEVAGEFVIYGQYKEHNDTTEIEEFKYKLPFTTIVSDELNKDTIVIDIEEFKYEQIDTDVLRIDINFSITGDLIERSEELVTELEPLEEIEIDEQIIGDDIDKVLAIQDTQEEVRDEGMIEIPVKEEVKVLEEEKISMEEYVTYHVHVVNNLDTLEGVIKQYNTNMDILKEYNEITELKIGDKLLIPEYLDE